MDQGYGTLEYLKNFPPTTEELRSLGFTLCEANIIYQQIAPEPAAQGTVGWHNTFSGSQDVSPNSCFWSDLMFLLGFLIDPQEYQQFLLWKQVNLVATSFDNLDLS